jgi:uncharacterized protein (DUF1015 family)
MTKIKPFNALIYNPEKIKDISRVVCPPYDVISAERQDYYHEASPCNFIRILLSKDSPKEDKYEAAGACFKEWQKNQIFLQDKAPAVYFYTQEYNIKGEKKTRYGFMVLLRLGDRNAGVFGHEHTRLAAKEDRLKLLKQVKANLSPIFVVFPDQKRIISRIREKYLHDQTPFIDIVDDEKTVHKVWRLDSPSVLSVIQESMSGEKIFIADGHHRYEVACAYRDEMEQKLGTVTGEESFNYILAYFTNTGSYGLTILPIHRLVHLGVKLDMNEFSARIADCFDLEEIRDKTKFFFLLNKAGANEHIIGMYNEKKYWFLRLKNLRILDTLMSDKPREYRLLDVSILNYLVLKKTLGLDLEDKEKITFSPHTDELIAQVDADPAYTAFFLNPVKVQQIMSIALNGEKMPAKSTYFYPKVLSGLVINKLE